MKAAAANVRTGQGHSGRVEDNADDWPRRQVPKDLRGGWPSRDDEVVIVQLDAVRDDATLPPRIDRPVSLGAKTGDHGHAVEPRHGDPLVVHVAA